MKSSLVVFDMDGVLVDVNDSYRETIQQTVEHFSGRRPTRDFIQEMKNQGGWNDDWSLSHQIILDYGVAAGRQEVVDYFQSIFLGPNHNGLVTRERWMPASGFFERLSQRHLLGVFSGRMREEIDITLRRFVPHVSFHEKVGMDDVERLKPAPDGLLLIASRNPGVKLWYVGDNVDDARCARAAGVPFVGIAHSSSPRHREMAELHLAEDALAVLDDINQLETVPGI